MKILFVSMHSIHAIRWIENLKDAQHELFWFDVSNRGTLNSAITITEFVGWKQRKIKTIKGEYYLYKKFPNFHFNIKKFFEITENEALEKIILDIKPDIVHSFEMQSCSYPILKTMNKYPNLRWIYSCWGSDLYYYKNLRNHKNKIKNTLKRINFLITDCKRDYKLAIKLEFSGTHLGVIPGGSGYDLEELNCYKKPINQRRIILVKGYQHTFGRALNVIKALQNINNTISKYEVVVFGAHKEVLDYIDVHNLPYKAYDRNALNQNQVIKLMGESLIYIGNTISDGMPNTLLEAICMNAFPIQSNPGNATSEIIDDGENGFLIENPEDIENIEKLIVNALSDRNRIIEGSKINTEIASNRLDYVKIKQKIINLYTDL